MKSKVLNNVKKTTKKVGHAVGNTVKVVVATVAAVATAEAAFVGAEMMQNDAALVKNCVAYKVKPESRTPYKVKKGMFGKTEVVTINPLNGKMDKYSGSKKPVNKKAIKVK